MNMPEIFTYQSVNAPPAKRWVAFFYAPIVGAKKQIQNTMLPLFVSGSSESEVEDKAESWWRGEAQKERNREAALTARQEGRARARAG